MVKLSDVIERKFVDSIDIDPEEWEIETESGWVDILQIHKTIEYEVYSIVLDNGLTLKCADTHILIDENNNEVYAKDSLGSFIKTKQGSSKVIQVENLGYTENMYDFSVDSEEHTYYTNDILSHNTITSAAYILWYTLFQSNKTVAVVANKDENARETLARYQLMYENLPLWMQQGIKTWNKADIELENGSKVRTSATSIAGLRSKSCVVGDTKICVELDNEDIYYIEIENVLNNIDDDIMDKYYAIYKITNLKNDKIYVGFHTIDGCGIKTDYIGVGSIFKDGYMGSGKLIKSAIEKYGPESFCQEILKVFDNKKEAEEYEKTIVNKDFTLDKTTYNLSLGGNVCILYGENCGFYGKKHTSESLQKIQETRNKNGLPTYQSKIMCTKTGIEYKGYNEICRYFDFEHSPEFNMFKVPVKNVRMFIYRLCYEGAIKILDEERNSLAIDRYSKYLTWIDEYEQRKLDFSNKVSARFLNSKQSVEHIKNRVNKTKLWVENNPELHALRMEKINKNPEKIAKTAEKHRGMKRSAEACKNISDSKKGSISSIKGKKAAKHKITGVVKYFNSIEEIPSDYIIDFSGYNTGKKSYTNGIEYKMFVEGFQPEGWWLQGPPKRQKIS